MCLLCPRVSQDDSVTYGERECRVSCQTARGPTDRAARGAEERDRQPSRDRRDASGTHLLLLFAINAQRKPSTVQGKLGYLKKKNLL